MTAPFQPHSASSRAAAKKIAPHLKSIRYRIYCFIDKNPGVTDDEIREHLDLNQNTARPRRIELERKGLVAWNGGVRVGHLGATALLWEVTGMEYPAVWNEKSRVQETETGEARLRRAFGRAFPVKRSAVELPLERLISRMIDNKSIVNEAAALRRVVKAEEFERMLLLIASRG